MNVDKVKESKQSQARELIEKYFFQLTKGCGKVQCSNNFCASSGLVDKLTGNQAAIKSLQLYAEHAKLCEINSPSVSAAIKDIEMTELPLQG